MLDPPAIFCQPSGLGGGSRTSNNHVTRKVLRADGTRAHVGHGVDSPVAALCERRVLSCPRSAVTDRRYNFVAVRRVKFAGETRYAWRRRAHGVARFFRPLLAASTLPVPEAVW